MVSASPLAEKSLVIHRRACFSLRPMGMTVAKGRNFPDEGKEQITLYFKTFSYGSQRQLENVGSTPL